MNSLNNLDLNLLKVFDAIYRERSVSVAANRLNMTQPAASNALNRLRQALGDQLFVRTRNGMEPTLLAQSIAGPVQQGLKGIATSILQGMSFDPAESERTFTILCIDVGEETYVAALMKVLEETAPNIDIKVLEAPLDEYENLLEYGYADFAIGRLEISDRFMREHIASCGYSALLCADHAEKIGITEGSVIPHELYLSMRHVHVLPRATPVHRHPVDLALRQNDDQRRVALTLPHTSVLSEILPGTSLIATVPDPAVQPIRARARLVQARLPFETEMLHILLIWHRRQQLDKGHSWMRAQIRSLPMSSWNLMDLRETG
ncbi:DNA-binding transcriptional regulator, LysR family [Lutimaribacter pacificus]|uniref:Transcriptional regulator, LysR family n=1 Tax=Lutimaribacter pacificus TaxID=391948 RepID=A0A1H0ENL2_9RHOB|nr:LysR family transcriptional regulator [Lutimaribacter pacificus]SDN83925.1 DNA-binding transcriptional regulator, LysR family [Lutimaribacter pacificus]SHK50864.1 transcriptional regulator, LysR family [Lutimaribacter pacificus]